MSSPDGTFGTVIETDQGTWSFGPDHQTMLATHKDNGYGSLYCWSKGVLYTQGAFGNPNWYVWKGNNHWELYGENPPIPLPVTPSLPRLVRRGAFFQLETGLYFTVIECTDFQLYQRFLEGEDIRPILAQRQAVGFNTVRVLGMCDQMFRLHPWEYGSFYSLLRAFFDLCTQHNLYVEFTVFADATVVMPTATQQVAHWQAVGPALTGVTNLLVECVNEADQPINRLAALQDLQPFPGVLCSHGSNGSQALPVRPWWDYETFHTNDAFQWQRKVGHNAMELSDGDPEGNITPSHRPVSSNENERQDKDGNINHFYDAAAGAALLCAGSCYHSTSGKFSTLFNEQELQFAQAWVNGAKSVPLEFQDGTYLHRQDLEPPGILRAYERRLPNGVGHIVTIRV